MGRFTGGGEGGLNKFVHRRVEQFRALTYLTNQLEAERPDGAERMDQLFRAVISAKPADVAKKEEKWKQARTNKRANFES
jgi:hypothetical protein